MSRTPSPKRPTTIQRPNLSSCLLRPEQVAAELDVSRREVGRLIILGPEHGGIRGIVIGSPGSQRPRRLVHREDLALWLRYSRGLLTKEQYLEKLRSL